MSLKDDLLEKGWLLEVPADQRKQSVNGLLSLTFRDIGYAEKGGWDPRFPLHHAFHAAENLANAALFAAGYRVVFEGHNYTIRTLAITIDASTDLIDRLESFRKKHDLRFDEPDGAVSVSEHDVRELISLAQGLNERVRAWLRSNHPELCNEFT